MIQPSEDRLFSELDNLLSWTSKRQQALAANVANMDTPGYHARDYSFEEQLTSSLTMTATASNHIAPMQEASTAQLYDVKTKEKPNGNNVDLEREMTEITKNGLQYITLVQYLNQKIRTLREAISEGGKG
jgi:flagellar basal-body rod protein FlgB